MPKRRILIPAVKLKGRVLWPGLEVSLYKACIDLALNEEVV